MSTELSTTKPDLNLFSPFASVVSNDCVSFSSNESVVTSFNLCKSFFYLTNITHRKSLSFLSDYRTSCGLNVNGGNEGLQVSSRYQQELVILGSLEDAPRFYNNRTPII